MPILITNDNFIIDGHIRYYIHKSSSKKSDNFIIANIVHSDYRTFMSELKKFKNEINFNELSRFKIDKEKLVNAKNAITNIEENIVLLKEYYKI